jgi:mandelate racemase
MSNYKRTLRSLTATAVALPMKRQVGTSANSIENACLLLVDLLTEDDIDGPAYAFCYVPSIARSLVPIVAELSNALSGLPSAPLDLAQRVSRHFRLPGVTGPLAMVASSVDTAAWDALAKSAGLPLATYLGATLEPIPAYSSNELG